MTKDSFLALLPLPRSVPQDQPQSGCPSQKLLCGKGSIKLFCVWITPESRRTQGHHAEAQRDKYLMVVGPQSPVSCEGPSYGHCLLALSHWGFHRPGSSVGSFSLLFMDMPASAQQIPGSEKQRGAGVGTRTSGPLTDLCVLRHNTLPF